jgi:hypothetical protein
MGNGGMTSLQAYAGIRLGMRPKAPATAPWRAGFSAIKCSLESIWSIADDCALPAARCTLS